MEIEVLQSYTTINQNVPTKNRALERLDQEVSQLKAKAASKSAQNYKFQCSICDDKFLLESTCKQHIDSHSTGVIVTELGCLYCSKSFDSEENLVKHQQKSHRNIVKELPHTCKLCHESFKSAKELNLHYTSHYSIEPKPKQSVFQCERCKKLFVR